KNVRGNVSPLVRRDVLRAFRQAGDVAEEKSFVSISRPLNASLTQFTDDVFVRESIFKRTHMVDGLQHGEARTGFPTNGMTRPGVSPHTMAIFPAETQGSTLVCLKEVQRTYPPHDAALQGQHGPQHVRPYYSLKYRKWREDFATVSQCLEM